jgi:formylglycine-generating enzyme required for sulfatase activity
LIGSIPPAARRTERWLRRRVFGANVAGMLRSITIPLLVLLAATSPSAAQSSRCDGTEISVSASERRCVTRGFQPFPVPSPRERTPAGVGCTARSTAFKDCPDCPQMVVVPAGTFVMGSPATEIGRSASEGPQHTVTIAKPFAVARFAVTLAEFSAFVLDTDHAVGGRCSTYERGYLAHDIAHARILAPEWQPRPARSFRDPGFFQDARDPVVCVSWQEARAFAAWLSKKTGKRYRLLTEAEREYATRAGTRSPFWWGSSVSPLHANFELGQDPSFGGRSGTVPVDSFMASPWGLYGMQGNVSEWVEDCWHENYRGAPGDGSAWTSGTCARRVHRGGAWSSRADELRAAGRASLPPDQRHSFIGFRVARDCRLALGC